MARNNQTRFSNNQRKINKLWYLSHPSLQASLMPKMVREIVVDALILKSSAKSLASFSIKSGKMKQNELTLILMIAKLMMVELKILLAEINQ